MIITHASSESIFGSTAEALVNPVNTWGVSGAGLALEFKRRFPENFRLYSNACKAGTVTAGQMFTTENHDLAGPQYIINFPTKESFLKPSKLIWITEGLKDLHRVIQEKGIKSIAIPAIGCGLGSLQWHQVRPWIERTASYLPNVAFHIYPPRV